MLTQTQTRTTLPTLTVSGNELSDLFFNHEKPNYDNVFRDKYEFSSAGQAEHDKDSKDALTEDAIEFAKMLGITNPEDLAVLLVNNFLERL